jgi:hypothetical protein
MNKQLYFYVNVKTYIDIIILLSRIIFVPSIKLNITFNKYISIRICWSHRQFNSLAGSVNARR